MIIVSYVLLIRDNEIITKEDPHPEFNKKTETIDKDTIADQLKKMDTVTQILSIVKNKSKQEKKVIKPTLKADTLITNNEDRVIKEEILTLDALKKKPQYFIINAERDTVLFGNEGTRLIIKANSFIDKNSVLINGKINIRLTEYYKLSDILFEDLTTTSDGKLLETGGMLFIDALKENRLLKLKEDASLGVEFPYEQKKENMQLFTGEETKGFINWQLGNRKLKLISRPNGEDLKTQAIKETSQNSFIVIEKAPVYPGCENGLNSRAQKCTADKIREFVAININKTLIEELNILRQRIDAVFKIDKTGVVKSAYTSSQQPELEAEIVRVLKTLPQMTPAKKGPRAVEIDYILPLILGQETNNIDRLKIQSTNRLPVVPPDTISFSSNVVISESNKANRYILRTSKLGWINYDRFTRSNKKKIKYRLKIKDAKGVDVKLIFKEISSVLPYKRLGEFYDFGTVPKGDTIKLVAIKSIDGKFYLDILDTKTKLNPNIEFDFEEVTLEELQQKIEELDNGF